MEADIQGQKIHYYQAGTGYPVLFLHGWGANIQAFSGIIGHLEKDFTIYALDLPGFGQSPPPDRIWGTAEYAQMVADFMMEKQIVKPILIGHSFGGRLSIRLGAKGLAKKIILVDSAGLRPKRSWRYYSKVYAYKAAKKIFLLPGLKNYREGVLAKFTKKTGSTDYQTATGIMRQVFVKVVNENLLSLLPQITAPTLLIWGDEDRDVPLAFGKTMENLIPDAGLVILKGAGHFSYLDRPGDFAVIIDNFLRQERMGEHA